MLLGNSAVAAITERIEALIVPGAAFDTAGNRLGRGKGYDAAGGLHGWGHC